MGSTSCDSDPNSLLRNEPAIGTRTAGRAVATVWTGVGIRGRKVTLFTLTSVTSTSAPPGGSTRPRCTRDNDNASRISAIRPRAGCYIFSLGWFDRVRSVLTNLQSYFCGVATIASVSSAAAITTPSGVVTMCSASARSGTFRSIAALTASAAGGTICLNPKRTVRGYERLDVYV